MTKSRKNSILKSVQKTSNKVLPVVDESLQTVGSTAKDVAKISIPIVEKGVSAVYGTMATGFNLGVKGVKGVSGVAKGMTKSKRSRRHKKGGKRTRRHRRRH
jgi:hypothetical protein